MKRNKRKSFLFFYPWYFQ